MPRTIIETLSKKRPFPPPPDWRKSSLEQLTLGDKVDNVILELMLKVTPPLRDVVDRGLLREKQGAVLGREGEDTQITIDRESENLARKIITSSARKYGLSLSVFSEHNHFQFGGKPEVVAALDPVDNSGEYEAGFNTPPYVSIGFFDMEGTPLGGGDSNLLTGHIFINQGGKNYEYNPNKKQLIELSPPRKIENIEDPEFRLVSYDGKYKYVGPFRSNFDRLDRDRNQDQVFHGKAGAHQYGDGVATGAVSLYIMFNEPISEVIQGMAFIRDAGYIPASVNLEDGTWEEFKFDVKYYLANPERYNLDRIPLLIVANSKPLLYTGIRYGFTKSFSDYLKISADKLFP